MEIMFRDHPGHRQIRNGEYELKDYATRRIIARGHPTSEFFDTDISGYYQTVDVQDAWSTCFSPGARLYMNILSKEQQNPHDSAALLKASRKCPRCGVENDVRFPCGARIW